MAERIFCHLMVLIFLAGYCALVLTLTDILTVGKHLIIAGVWLMAGAGIFIETERPL